MHVGIISSSGGQTFREFHRGVQHLNVSFTVVTDRACGIESVARERGIRCVRLEGDRTEFSKRAARELSARDVDFVLLCFNRLVGAELYEALPTYNIHPSLLPAFPGFGALDAALERQVRFVGATLHVATEQTDGGPIVAQVCSPVWPPCEEGQISELSFVQRVYLSLLCVELTRAGVLDVNPAHGTARFLAPRPYTERCNPAIQDEQMLAIIAELEATRAIKVTG